MEIDETAIAAAAAAVHNRSRDYNILAVASAMVYQVCPPLSQVAIERRRGTILGSSRLASSTFFLVLELKKEPITLAMKKHYNI